MNYEPRFDNAIYTERDRLADEERQKERNRIDKIVNELYKQPDMLAVVERVLQIETKEVWVLGEIKMIKLELNYQQFAYLRSLATKDSPKIYSIDESIRSDVLKIMQDEEDKIQSILTIRDFWILTTVFLVWN